MMGHEPEWMTKARLSLFDAPVISKYIQQDETTAALMRDPLSVMKSTMEAAGMENPLSSLRRS